jgi:RNA polymerase sigma-70 factor (ECF subfamily)
MTVMQRLDPLAGPDRFADAVAGALPLKAAAPPGSARRLKGWDWHEVRRGCSREAARVLRDPNDVDDAAQEAALRAWLHRDALADGEAESGWLRQIAHREALRVVDRNRRAAARAEVLAAHTPAGEAAPADAFVEAAGVRQALGALGEEERRTVLLRYAQDLTQSAIADRLGLPEGTVKIRLHRARRRLRAALEGEA